MRDPVFIASGHTCDRRSITKWFQQGHQGVSIDGTTVKKYECMNFALRNAIVGGRRRRSFGIGRGGAVEERVAKTDGANWWKDAHLGTI